MGKAYVSEFANFMDQYLKDHPAEVEEQRHAAGVLLPGERRPDSSMINPADPRPRMNDNRQTPSH